MNYAVTNYDILRFFPHSKILSYAELSNISNVEELFTNDNKCFILYELTADYGHWILLFLKGSVIFFFDSYGLFPDKELLFVTSVAKNITYPFLSELFIQTPKSIDYNQYKLQKFSRGINTCGKWCIVRALSENLSTNEFYNYFKNISNKDKAVNTIWNRLR